MAGKFTNQRLRGIFDTAECLDSLVTTQVVVGVEWLSLVSPCDFSSIDHVFSLGKTLTLLKYTTDRRGIIL